MSTSTSPHAVCWLSIPIILLAGLLFKQHAIDFQLYDTYYVLGIIQYAGAVAILIGFFGLIYWMMRKAGKKLNYSMSFLHIAITIVTLTIIALLASNANIAFQTFFALLFTFAAAQIIFLVNVILSFFRR
ncbi:hypothetical protein [Dyadobacter luticola]|uniref:Uncharacterized protein n=1 Tax=Dyadobacter luticola TaxID=1979387 RepID=A0A5R9L1R9_9BACT|nr:hypothetical protein [Dyadobacter luticola]TLV02496.1 hypothetical protein FEN17_02390 [Dyadobacter luticola]